MKHVLVVCDSFKGSLSSAEMVQIANDVFHPFPEIELSTRLFADGGEGSLACVASVLKGEQRQVVVPGIFGQPRPAHYLIHRQQAYIEVAAVCGIHDVPIHQLNPYLASSDGVGWLIRDAIEQGCNTITMFLGGTATVDGGTGMMRALGVRFFDESGVSITEVNPLPVFSQVQWGDWDSLLEGVQFEVVCDVRNALLGTEGGVRVFGPQKGLLSVDVDSFERQMMAWIKVLDARFPNHHKMTGFEPFGGAAGGLGLPFLNDARASFHLGFDWFRNLLELDLLVQKADVVITGEGRIDHQTNMGKGVGQLALLCRTLQKPVYAICGSTDYTCDLFNQIFILGGGHLTREESMSQAHRLFAEQLVQLVNQL